jgi:hypothetical protein
MPESQVLKPEEARKRLLLAYRTGNETSFLEMLKSPVLDAIDQRDAKGNRRLHSLFVVGGVLALLAVVAFLFFTLHK